MRRTAGFSLIEILVAILIAGIVAAIAIPVFTGQRNRAKDHKAAQTLETALQQARSVFTSDETYPADVAARMTSGESTLTVTSGTGFMPGQVAVDRPSASRVIMRTQSATGINLLVADDAAAGLTQRLKGNTTGMDLGTVTNLSMNPGAENNTNDMTGTGGATVTRTTAWATSGQASFQCAGAATGGSGTYCTTTNGPVTAGQPYSFSVDLNITTVTTGGISVWLSFYTGGGALINGATVGSTTVTTGVKKITATAVAPATATSAHLSFHANPAMSGQPFSFMVDSTIWCQCSKPPVYFDGDSPAGTWTGTPGNSRSTGPAAAEQF